LAVYPIFQGLDSKETRLIYRLGEKIREISLSDSGSQPINHRTAIDCISVEFPAAICLQPTTTLALHKPTTQNDAGVLATQIYVRYTVICIKYVAWISKAPE
jgi:hypothetical protein